MKGYARLSVLAAAGALALLEIATGHNPAFAQASDFKIGWILPQIGPVAELAKQYADGVDVGLDMINSSGGFGGHPGKLIVCDSQGREAQAVICAKKLINDDGVTLLLGATGTPQTMAIEATVDAASVPLFAIAGGDVAWIPVKKWVFKSISGNEDSLPAGLKFAAAKGWKSAALIGDNSVFGVSVAEMTKRVAKRQGFNIIDDEVYAMADTDVTAQITHIRSLHPDFILNNGQNLTTCSMVNKTIAQLGMQTPIIFTGTNCVLEEFTKLTPESIGQTYFPGSKVFVGNLSSDDPLHDQIMGFRDHYKKMRGNFDKMTSNTAEVADDLLFTATVAKPLGDKVLDRAALRDAIEGAKHVPGIQGFWSFTPDNHGSDFSDGFKIIQYIDGKWVLAK